MQPVLNGDILMLPSLLPSLVLFRDVTRGCGEGPGPLKEFWGEGGGPRASPFLLEDPYLTVPTRRPSFRRAGEPEGRAMRGVSRSLAGLRPTRRNPRRRCATPRRRPSLPLASLTEGPGGRSKLDISRRCRR